MIHKYTSLLSCFDFLTTDAHCSSRLGRHDDRVSVVFTRLVVLSGRFQCRPKTMSGILFLVAMRFKKRSLGNTITSHFARAIHNVRVHVFSKLFKTYFSSEPPVTSTWNIITLFVVRNNNNYNVVLAENVGDSEHTLASDKIRNNNNMCNSGRVIGVTCFY